MSGTSGVLQRSLWDEDLSWRKQRVAFQKKLVEMRRKRRLEKISLGFHS